MDIWNVLVNALIDAAILTPCLLLCGYLFARPLAELAKWLPTAFLVFLLACGLAVLRVDLWSGSALGLLALNICLVTGMALAGVLSRVYARKVIYCAFLGMNPTTFLAQLSFTLSSRSDSGLLRFGCMLVVSLLLSLGVWRLFHRTIAHLLKNGTSAERMKYIWIVYAMPLFIMLLLSFAIPEHPPAMIAVSVVCLITAGLFYWLSGRLITLPTEIGWNETKLGQLFDIQEQKYMAMSKYIHEVRVARHDLRHHLSVIEQYIFNGDRDRLQEYITGIGSSAEFESSLSVCGNFAVDAVARHYLDQAAAENIKLDVSLDIPESVGFPSADLCILLGNCLENAVDAAKNSPDGRRFIRVRSQNDESRLIVIIGNSFEGALNEIDGRFLSIKQPARQGIGLSSIRAVTEKYNGAAHFKAEDGVFTANLILFKPEADHAHSNLRTHSG